MGTQDEQKLRLLNLNKAAIDVWSTREKLALATSVQKSGDQNWNSVSRPLKAFAEDNRPADWFNPKYCAIQYRDMLEKIEVPKRKRERKERAEETAPNLIVKKLTFERIDELAINIRDKIVKFCDLKTRLDKMKTGNYDEALFTETCNLIQEKEMQKREAEIDHKKWLEDRETKIVQMSRKVPINKLNKSTVPVVIETQIDEYSETKTIADKESVKREIVDPLLQVLHEKDNSLLSSLLQTTPQTSPASPQRLSLADQNEMKNTEKLESVVEVNAEDIITEEVEVTHDIVKVDTPDSDEVKSVSYDETMSEESDQRDNIPDEAKNEITTQQENSNDTIEEAFESNPEPQSNDEEAGSEIKIELSKISNDNFDSVSNIDSEVIVSENLVEDSNSKEQSEIKLEEDSSISIFDTKNSSLDTTTDSNVNSLTQKIRRKRRRSNKIANTSVMQTRSTRSQSNIKVEEPKSSSHKMDTAKINSKKRSNSADDTTSLDNTISEESNDDKSSNNESIQNEEIVDSRWKKSGLFIYKAILNDRNSSFFTQPLVDEQYRKGVLREMDLSLIKKRIESGLTKNNSDLKKDILHMFSNVFMLYSANDREYKAAIEMESNILPLFETSQQKVTRTRERASHVSEIHMKASRRKTRGSITLENKSSKKKKIFT